MTTQTVGTHHAGTPARQASTKDAVRYVAPLGRALLSAIFLLSGPMHFSKTAIGYAASQGVPLAGVLVPLSGILAILGGLSVLLGYRARIGAWMLVAFLVPVTAMMHQFWRATDPMMAQIQQAMFMKNLAMMGGALLIAYFGAGPISFDARVSTRKTW